MSFLARTSFRAASRATFAPRAFSTSLATRKTPVEKVKEEVQKVDKAVAGKIVDGIEAGEKAAAKAREAAGISKGKANEVAGEASGKASELTGEAKGKASELSGAAKGKTEELKGKL